jgi:hypothetical protein
MYFLTIVVAGDQQDFTQTPVDLFLQAVDFGLSKVPTTDLEMIFVEYSVRWSVREDVEMQSLLHGHDPFISFDEEKINKSSHISKSYQRFKY